MKNLKSAACAVLAALALVPAGLTTLAIAAESTETALIPRNAIFGNPERAGAQISPDGKYNSPLPNDQIHRQPEAVRCDAGLGHARPGA